ncbi:MAG TPA: hypothetical protein VJ865_00405, partial [Gemmatimonadaceae bacterium]|nr:hypothetical protein [Gemmatimonadaceae bacterium]
MEQYGTRSIGSGPWHVRFLAVALAAMVALTATDALAKPAKKQSTFNVVPILVQSVTVQDGQLMANGLVGT